MPATLKTAAEHNWPQSPTWSVVLQPFQCTCPLIWSVASPSHNGMNLYRTPFTSFEHLPFSVWFSPSSAERSAAKAVSVHQLSFVKASSRTNALPHKAGKTNSSDMPSSGGSVSSVKSASISTQVNLESEQRLLPCYCHLAKSAAAKDTEHDCREKDYTRRRKHSDTRGQHCCFEMLHWSKADVFLWLWAVSTI